ncbi:MAG: aminomethyl transferase family protein [Gammaproteobacteria bacterium]|nr:aminomethyl transferase family protein [Gammaproteobacteria bacterium]
MLDHGAVMGQVYGWERALWYAPEGVEAKDEPSFYRPNWWQHVGNEAHAMTTGCGLSEMSTYGKFRVSGTDAHAFLDHVGSASVPSEAGRMVLSLLLNERGGIVGDVTIANEGNGSYYLVGATTGVALYQRWLEDHAQDLEVRIDNVTDQYAALGIAGPNSRALLNALSNDAFTDFPFMRAREVEIGRLRCTALRVSYSGELGWELHCPMVNQQALFETLMAAGPEHGLALMGSRAMGMLRLEKGYRSWGAEMTTEVTPHAAGLEKFCSQKKDYIGSAIVDDQRQNPPPKRFVTLEVDAAAPPCWGTEPVLNNGELIGYVTSGGMGWRTGKALAVGWIDASHAAVGTQLDLQILLKTYAAIVVADPVYDLENSRLLS